MRQIRRIRITGVSKVARCEDYRVRVVVWSPESQALVMLMRTLYPEDESKHFRPFYPAFPVSVRVFTPINAIHYQVA